MNSSPSFQMLARVSINAALPLLFILFHTAQGSGSAFNAASQEPIQDSLTAPKALAHQVARQFHSHEYSSHEETQQDTDKANEEKKKSIEFGDIWCIGSVQDYET